MKHDAREYACAFETSAVAQMERILLDLHCMYEERNAALKEVARAHHDALLRLSIAADFKDDDTGVHIIRIGYLSEALACRLGETPAFGKLLRQAAPMHDIGKIGIPDDILKKPGPLIPAEREVMKQHPAMGAKILGRSRIPLFQLAADVAMAHHERFDGQGYPQGLAGDDIPLAARIVSVVDFFDALTMDRVYRRALADGEVLDMIRAEAGRAFDPRVVGCFLDHARLMIDIRERINEEKPTFEHLVE